MLKNLHAIAVTGTDTGVGKTVVACAIAADAAARGLLVRVMKPVETGIENPDEDRDARRLRRAANSRQRLDEISPLTFRQPLAPLAAARASVQRIDVAVLDTAYAAISAGADLVVVEGAGGLLVPLTETESFASLFKRWKLPLIIVAPNRLGVINHVLLTVQAARARGLTVHAVALHDQLLGTLDVSAATNGQILNELLPTVPIIRFPWVPSPTDLRALIAAARDSGLVPLGDLRASPSS